MACQAGRVKIPLQAFMLSSDLYANKREENQHLEAFLCDKFAYLESNLAAVSTINITPFIPIGVNCFLWQYAA
jgi:hypothetical protein